MKKVIFKKSSKTGNEMEKLGFEFDIVVFDNEKTAKEFDKNAIKIGNKWEGEGWRNKESYVIFE